MIKLRLFDLPKWELVKVLDGGVRLERLASKEPCHKCGKKHAFRFRTVSVDGDTTYLMAFSYCSTCCLMYEHVLDAAVGNVKSTGD